MEYVFSSLFRLTLQFYSCEGKLSSAFILNCISVMYPECEKYGCILDYVKSITSPTVQVV
jgi:hypothetical protein